MPFKGFGKFGHIDSSPNCNAWSAGRLGRVVWWAALSAPSGGYALPPSLSAPQGGYAPPFCLVPDKRGHPARQSSEAFVHNGTRARKIPA